MTDRRLRVALVNHTARMGGAEWALLRIAERLDPETVDPVAVLGDDGPLAERLREAGLEVVVTPLGAPVTEQRKDDLRLSGLARPGLALRTVAATVQLTRLFRAHGFDVVHTNTLKADLVGGLAGRLAGARVVWHVRDHISEPYLPTAAVRMVRLAARVIPHRVIAASASAARTVGRSDVVVVHQGVVLPELLPAERADGSLTVGLVGRIAAWKGQDVFIDAAARLAGEFPDVEFLLAGAPLFGEEAVERELRHRVEARGLVDRVHFLGFRDDVWEVYRQLDVAVHASTLPEPYGNVILEAMASGTSLVASAAGGVLELVDDGRTGLLVAPGDADALAAAVGRLLRSPEERRRLADAGRRHVEERFSLDRDAREVERVWRSAVGRCEGAVDAERAG